LAVVTESKPEPRTFTEVARRQQIVGAAIDTIAEVGYAQASLARIAERAGISKGVISYHFTGKDELIKQVVNDVIEAGRAYILPRLLAESTGPATLRAYIESNLAFMREHRNSMAAVVEILRNGAFTPDGRGAHGEDLDVTTRFLQEQLGRLQAGGELRSDFDPGAMAVAIRAAIDVVPHRLVIDPNFDIDTYAKEIATVFDLATRAEDTPDTGVAKPAD
jgi:TetR/AcrR family transcriptional regulator, fatty acid metabolism regulator protein